ncbi:hypothetical protein QYM36_011871, partial [Artemia franciscana]
MYFYEICHSLRVAERVAVPLRSVRRGSRVKGWASNSELVKARAAAKFWLGVWHECDRPRSGVVNELRVYTKRRFAKELRKHRSSLKRETVSKIIENPNLVWKLRARPVESTGQNASDIDEEIWVDYFAAEFSPPDEVKNKKFSEELDQLMTKEHNYLMEYDEIGLSFNVTKCEVLLFNWNASQPEIQLGSQVVMPSKSIVYLGLPIGETLQHTRALLVKHIEKKIRGNYIPVVLSVIETTCATHIKGEDAIDKLVSAKNINKMVETPENRQAIATDILKEFLEHMESDKDSKTASKAVVLGAALRRSDFMVSLNTVVHCLANAVKLKRKSRHTKKKVQKCQKKVGLNLESGLLAVGVPAPSLKRPWSDLPNPYPYGCSPFCNHPRDPELRDVLLRAKDVSGDGGTSKKEPRYICRRFFGGSPDDFFARYLRSDSRATSPGSPAENGNFTRFKSYVNRRCITPDGELRFDRRKTFILALPRSRSFSNLPTPFSTFESIDISHNSTKIKKKSASTKHQTHHKK